MSGVAKHTYTKMNQDIARSKFSPEIYYEGRNIRILTNEAFGSITNTKGNEFIAELPDINSNPTTTKTHLNKLPFPLTNPTLVGHTYINEDLYLLSKYAVENPFAKLFYSQVQSGDPDAPGPYIDSNIRVIIDNDEVNAFFNFDSTNGVVEGPQLPTNTSIKVTAFAFGSEPNQPAPNPTIYLEVYKNNELIFKQSKPVDYAPTAVTDITYEFETEFNSVYYFYAYTLPEPGFKANPFTGIDIFDYIVEGDIFTIHQVDKDYNVNLKFIDIYNIGNNKVDTWGFYENQNVQKLYWTNGTNELSFINIADPNVLKLNRKFLSTVPNVVLEKPEIIGFTNTGSSHTSGSIQYAYNLYKLNGAQSKISPLSDIAYLNNGDKGQDVNIRVDKAITLSINNIDTLFDRIKIYSIKYNSLNSTPEIKVIYENVVTSSLEITDDNNTNLSTISLPEFLFLGGDRYIPKHIFIKDNRLFLANYKTEQFDIDFDTRAYRYDINGETVILDKGTPLTFNKTSIPNIPLEHDAINPTNKAIENTVDWNKYIWKETPTVIDPGGQTTAPATFGNLFIQLSSQVVTEEYYFNADDSSGSPQSYDYLTGFIDTETVYSVNPLYTATGRTIDGVDVGLAVENLCNVSVPNYIGDYEWSVDIVNPTTIKLRTVFRYDDRCSTPPSNTKPVTISLSNGTTTDTVSFNLVLNNDTNPEATVGITSFNPGNIVITTVTPPTISGGVLGGIGPNVEFEIKYKTVPSNIGEASLLSSPNLATVNNPAEFSTLKSGEVYRMFIEFQLDNGAFLFPKWVADIKIPEIGTAGSLPPVDASGNINYCYIETKLINIPTDSRIIGWRTAIVERTEADKTVITQGLLNPVLENKLNNNTSILNPSYIQRTVRNNADTPTGTTAIGKPHRINSTQLTETSVSNNTTGAGEVTTNFEDIRISHNSAMVYSPEIILNKNLFFQGGRLRKLGLIENKFSDSYREVFDTNGALVDTLADVPGDFNISRSEFLTGANLLLNFGINNINDAARFGKLISDNKKGTTEIYSKKQLAFTRYFGGIKYPRIVFDSTNNMSVNSRLGIVQPILNTFVLPQTNPLQPNIRIAGRPEIILKFPLNEIIGTFNYYTGTGILVNEINTMGIVNYPELPSGDNGDFGVLVEFYRQLPNQYGGDTYNARQLNRTIPYSNIVSLTVNSNTTEHKGDTFIQKFNFLKTFKANSTSVQIAEIVSFPVETTINLDLRWDILKNRPDNFDADELTSYGFNRAYDQQNNTVKGITKPLNFTELNDFPVNIIPSKLKVAGELIDSFTDFLVNDIKTLDGKYGEITGIGEHSDNVFAFQRNAVSFLAINPRVQIQTNDTIPIELGSGGIIERYQYLTTSSGTLNKWSIVKTNNGLMYVDLLNKSINFIGADNNKMSTVNGLYNKLFNYVDTHLDTLKVDNPVTNQGIIAYYDNLKEETYFTFLTNNPFTVSYNGLAQGFVSFYDFFPRHYLTVNGKMITTNDNKRLWEHNTLDSMYNFFYGSYYPSHVTVLTNDNPDFNKIFDNLHFNTEFYDKGSMFPDKDVPEITFNRYRLWNEYQDTGDVNISPLDYRSLSKRRLRKWNLIIPREAGTRNRLSNPWVFVKLEFNKLQLQAPYITPDYQFVLHDLLVSYTMKP